MGASSAWTKRGSNFDAVDDGDALFSGYQNPGDTGIGETSGTAAAIANPNSVHTRYECHVWLDGTSEIFTKPFDFMVQGDLTICVNASKIHIDLEQDDCDLKMYGSVTGDSTHYVEMKSIDTGMDIDNAVYVAVYDFDESGRLPFMKLGITQETSHDNTDKPIKVVVIPH